MYRFIEKILSTLWKPSKKTLKINTSTPPQQQPVVKETPPPKVDLRATKQLDTRFTKPIGRL
jgi:hypothetical protein